MKIYDLFKSKTRRNVESLLSHYDVLIAELQREKEKNFAKPELYAKAWAKQLEYKHIKDALESTIK